MEQEVEINNLQKFFNWIEINSRCSVRENEKDFFRIATPFNNDVFVNIDENDDMNDIVRNTIEVLNDFDIDERFIELWDNKFSPSQFIRILKEDEETFCNLADKLREYFLSSNS